MKRNGFSLIELLITLAVIGVLAALTVPVADLAVRRTREDDLRQGLRELRNAIDAYKRASDEGRIPKGGGESGYPPNLSLLAEGVLDVTRKPIYFIRRIPRDPFADGTARPEDSWRTRAYEDPPGMFRPGRDVFDVASSSDEIGTDRIPYREW